MIKKIIKSSILLSVLFCTLFVNSISVSAVTLDNNGDEKENPYGDSGLDKSFSEAEYYDCYMPYGVTLKEIGGYATGAIWAAYDQYNAPMSESMQNSHVGTFVNYENDLLGSNSTLSSAFQGMDWSYESETGMSIVTDNNGTQYYISAFPGFFFYNSAAGSNGFPEYSSSAWGTAVDIILTDGTVIHFAMGDSVAPQHSNGGIDNPVYFDVIYENAPMNMSQYLHLFQAQSGHSVEVWGRSGCSQAFMDKYNIGDGEDQNKIAIARVYNTKVSDNPTRSQGLNGDVSYSLGDVDISSSSTGTDSMGNQIVSEWELVGMKGLKNRIGDSQTSIELKSRDSLSLGEGYSTQVIGDNIALANQANVLTTARVAVVFIGLCMVFYAVVLLLTYMFDRVNSFIDISLVKIATFGYLEYTDEDLGGRQVGKASSGRIIFLTCSLMVIGCLFVSGGVIPFIMQIVFNLLEKFL